MGEASSCPTSKRKLRYGSSISLGCASAGDRPHQLVCGGVGIDRTCGYAVDELPGAGERCVDGAAQTIEDVLAHRGVGAATAARAGRAVDRRGLRLGRQEAPLAMALARLGQLVDAF